MPRKRLLGAIPPAIADHPIEVRFDGMPADARDMIDRRVIDPAVTATLLEEVFEASGTSRSRKKAGTKLFALLLSLYATRAAVPDGLMPALASVLRLEAKRATVEALSAPPGWLTDDEQCDRACLKLISFVADTQSQNSAKKDRTSKERIPLAARRMMYTLVDGHRRSGLNPIDSYLCALGVTLQVIDPVEGGILESAGYRIFGADLAEVRTHAHLDAKGLHEQGRRTTIRAHSLAHTGIDGPRLSRLRTLPLYADLEARELARLRRVEGTTRR